MRLNAQSSLLSLKQSDYLGKLPNVVSQARRHRRSDAQRLVDAREVVVNKVERHCEPMVLHFLAEAIGQAGETAHSHSHREVLPLRVACADGVAVWRAKDNLSLRAGDDAGAVFAFAPRLRVNLHDRSVIDWRAVERAFHGQRVSLVPVRRNLNALRETGREVAKELVGAHRCAVAHIPSWDQLCRPVDGNPSPDVPGLASTAQMRWNVLLLRVAEAPNLVALKRRAWQVHHDFCGELLARFTKVHSEPLNGLPCESSHAASGALAVAFHKAGNGARAVFVSESVHRSRVGFGDGLTSHPLNHARRDVVSNVRSRIRNPLQGCKKVSGYALVPLRDNPVDCYHRSFVKYPAFNVQSAPRTCYPRDAVVHCLNGSVTAQRASLQFDGDHSAPPFALALCF